MLQVYLYEINKLLQPSARPRQVLPYAVVTYTENGVYLPAIDVKPTAKEKLAGNPRLQEIIKAINCKQSSSSPDTVTTPDKEGILQGPVDAQLSPLKPIPSAAMATGMPVTLNNGLKPLNGMIATNGVKMPDSDRNSQLQLIISQINSKFDTDKLPKGPQARSSGGDSILGNPPLVVTAANGTYSSVNGTFTNGSLGSGSPLGSRPGSAESLLSVQGLTQSAAKAPLVSPTSLAPQRFGLLHDALKPQPIAPMFSSLQPQLGFNLGQFGAQAAPQAFLPRKDMFELGGVGLSSTMPLGLYPSHPLQSPFMPSLAGDQLRGALPLPFSPFTSTLTAASLPQLQQSPLMLRPATALKRAFPDPSTLDWDKRPKLF